MSSGSGSGRRPPRGSNPTPAPSRTAAGVAVNLDRHRCDRSRSRSPRSANSSDDDTTPSDSFATPRNSTLRDAATCEAMARDGASGGGTPQDAKINLKLSHILIKHKESRRPIDNEDNPVTRTKDEAMELVTDIHEKITRNLITFADAAVSFSDCTSARHEGDIQSQFKSGRMQKSFEDAALALTPGQISNIVESNSGYHIIQRLAVAGATADSHSHRRDRTRSRSPRLATPSGSDATSGDTVATPRESTHRDAAARDAAARETTGRDATPRDGSSRGRSSHDRTPQGAKINLKFSHILIKHKESRRPIDNEDKPVTRTKDQAMELVIDIHDKITRDLITFADAAVSFSDCTSARHEGDIQSQFKSGRVQKSFEDAALALTPGQISNIIESKSGYHIIQRRE